LENPGYRDIFRGRSERSLFFLKPISSLAFFKRDGNPDSMRDFLTRCFLLDFFYPLMATKAGMIPLKNYLKNE
jgi:hypothetical protein